MKKNEFIALVIDDERLARKELIRILTDLKCTKDIYEARNVSSAKKMIETEKPNLLFLDIQMPGETGFDLLEQIEYDGHIIFVTAYDQYAIRAFEVNALDYLLKPVTPERLKKSIERINKKEKVNFQELDFHLKYEDRIFMPFRRQHIFLKISSIKLIESEGDYTKITTVEGKEGLISKSMKEWEFRLPHTYFCRIHRTTIINLEYIENIQKWYNNSYKLYLKDSKKEYIISRRYAKQIKEKFG